uniref:Reverse transcriptase zinc-binding domain-containing protein n=1 Tax=Anolis carolinensis TaxID=28377 RepID=A0A803TG80_ANOCA
HKREFAKEKWITYKQMWKTKLKYSSSLKIKENWYKMFFRWYLTSQKLSKYYKNQNKECWKCGVKVGTFLHAWWECKEIKKFWKKIHDHSQKNLNRKFDLKPEYYLLNLMDIELGRNKDILFFHMTGLLHKDH